MKSLEILALWLRIEVVPGKWYPITPGMLGEIRLGLAHRLRLEAHPGRDFMRADLWLPNVETVTIETAVTSSPDGVPEFETVDRDAGPDQVLLACESRILITEQTRA